MNCTKYIYRILFFLLMLMPLVSISQNNTSSPYSVFGAGDLSNVAYGRNLALGGTGYALRGSSFLNLKNPASLTAIDSLTTLFETGVFGKVTQNTSSTSSVISYDGNITHLTLGHRYTSRLMGSYGLMPFSDIGYNFRTIKSVEGENSDVLTGWNGTGGISKIFYALGLKINKNFSLGTELAYYNGPVQEVRRTTAIVQPDNTTAHYFNSNYSGFSYKGAFQFLTNIGDKGSNITIGGVIAPAKKLTGKTIETINQSYSSTVVVPILSEETNATPINIPISYGGGLSFVWQAKYLLTADYETSLWSMNNTREYIDREIYSVGFERLPRVSFKYFDRCSYRLGFRYDSGYFETKGLAIDDTRFTIGMGFPIQKSRSTINVSLEAGQRGTTSMGLIRERYTKLTVAFSFHDYWFIKRKID